MTSYLHLDLYREATKATLAKNLVVARMACELTQEQLAQAAGISRATIAQIENGSTDPRLSTIVDLATAMDTSPILLLLGEDELRALVKVVEDSPKDLLPELEVDQMRRLIASGLGKQRIKAAALGATAAHAVGLSSVGAAIGSGLMPGMGTVLGGLMGMFLNPKSTDEDK